MTRLAKVSGKTLYIREKDILLIVTFHHHKNILIRLLTPTVTPLGPGTPGSPGWPGCPGSPGFPGAPSFPLDPFSPCW